MSKKKIPGATTHPREWRIWRAMRSRCAASRKPNPDYERYRRKNITVCPEWNSSDTGFQQFLFDMGPCPSEEYSIDRINNDGGYCPANCRWATRKEQAWNTDNNRMLTFEGETLPITEWARKKGLHQTALKHRLDAGNWSLKDALETPNQSWGKLSFKGETLTPRQWSFKLNINLKTIYKRLKEGLPVEGVLYEGDIRNFKKASNEL